MCVEPCLNSGPVDGCKGHISCPDAGMLTSSSSTFKCLFVFNFKPWLFKMWILFSGGLASSIFSADSKMNTVLNNSVENLLVCWSTLPFQFELFLPNNWEHHSKLFCLCALHYEWKSTFPWQLCHGKQLSLIVSVSCPLRTLTLHLQLCVLPALCPHLEN